MNKALALKPVIRELVRTNVCFADIKLLVDKINIVQLAAARSADAYEAYRLFLTDRETTIQGLSCLTTVHSGILTQMFDSSSQTTTTQVPDTT